MRSNLWPLLRVQLIYSWRGTLERMAGTKSKWGMLLLPLIALGFIPLIGISTLFWSSLYGAFALLGQGEMLLTLALTAGQLVCLVFGILYVISVFYFSQDLKILVPLPLRPGEIVLSKFVGIMIGEYLTMAPVVLPALAVYGVRSGASLLYIPLALLIYLMLPVIPLVLSGLFSLALMRVTNLRRNRDFVRVLGAVVGLGIAMSFQFWGRYQQQLESPEALQQFLEGQQPPVNSLGKWAVTSVWATQALQAGAGAERLLSFLLYAGIAAVALFLLIRVSERIFFGGLLGGEESTASGRKLTRAELTKETSKVRSPIWALFWREVKMLNRTPSFLMAGLLPPLLMPFFMIMPLAGPGGPLQGGSDLSRYAEMPLTPVVVIAASLFLNNLSAIPSSAISREGRWFWISRSLPIPPRLQIQAKLLHSLLFSMINLIVLIGAMLWTKTATPFNLLLVLVGGLLGSIVTGYSGLLIDVMRPNLGWTDPQQAMKGNLNSLFALVLNLILALVTGVAATLLYLFARPLFLPGLLLLLAAEGWALGKATAALADRRYVAYEL